MCYPPRKGENDTEHRQWSELWVKRAELQNQNMEPQATENDSQSLKPNGISLLAFQICLGPVTTKQWKPYSIPIPVCKVEKHTKADINFQNHIYYYAVIHNYIILLAIVPTLSHTNVFISFSIFIFWHLSGSSYLSLYPLTSHPDIVVQQHLYFSNVFCTCPILHIPMPFNAFVV